MKYITNGCKYNHFDNTHLEGDILMYGAENSINSYFDRKSLLYTANDDEAIL